MSRIGKKAVPVPSGVTANVEGQTVKVKGPKGALQLVLHGDVEAKMDKGSIQIDPRSETKRARSQWGMRTLVNNLMVGVTKGFEENLEITGVGSPSRGAGQEPAAPARLQPRRPSIGSRKASRSPPPKPTEIKISGSDKQKVGQVAAEIRGFRPPEPYKGKGVKYAGEYIFRKEGKKK